MRSLALVPLVALVASASAQVVLNTDNFATSGGSAYKNVVRDGSGTLFCVSVSEDASGNRPLLLLRSVDGGGSWAQLPVTLNDPATGLTPPDPTTNTALAIDDRGVLHVIWGEYHYPSYYQQWYRQYDPSTGVPSATVDLSALTGAAATSRTAGMDIAVDAGGTVWVAGHGPGSWVEVLLRSDAPYASSLAFTSVGSISPSASAQNARLCVDASGLVHCSYYRNISPGVYEHRAYDPVLGWQPETILGDLIAPNDYYGAMAADLLGNVHALYVVDASSSAAVMKFRYRRWDATSGWGAEVALLDVTSAQFTGVANYKIFALACDESSGKATAIVRDLTDLGQLKLFEKGLGDAAFTAGADVTAPGSGNHEYYVPTLRGSLYPDTNRSGTRLDATWQWRPNGTTPYSLLFDALGTGLSGTPGTISLSLGGSQVLSMDVDDGLAGKSYQVLGSASGTAPGIPYGGRVVPLNFDPYLVFTLLNPNTPLLNGSAGVLNSLGQATAVFTLPPGSDPALAGLTVSHAGLVIDLVGGFFVLPEVTDAAAVLLVP